MDIEIELDEAVDADLIALLDSLTEEERYEYVRTALQVTFLDR